MRRCGGGAGGRKLSPKRSFQIGNELAQHARRRRFRAGLCILCDGRLGSRMQSAGAASWATILPPERARNRRRIPGRRQVWTLPVDGASISSRPELRPPLRRKLLPPLRAVRGRLGFGGLDFLPHRRQLCRARLQFLQLGEDHASLLGHGVRQVEAKLFDGFGDGFGLGLIVSASGTAVCAANAAASVRRRPRLPTRQRYQFHSLPRAVRVWTSNSLVGAARGAAL